MRTYHLFILSNYTLELLTRSVVLADSSRCSSSRRSSSTNDSDSDDAAAKQGTDAGMGKGEEQALALEEVTSLNPWVGEPEVLAAQLYFRWGDDIRAGTMLMLVLVLVLVLLLLTILIFMLSLSTLHAPFPRRRHRPCTMHTR